ncbi:DNA double-strand break repair protein Mre11 [uncultured archaeon]|nr:DNA double-strand break repair protein Mre11 [uncultured archaeon]
MKVAIFSDTHLGFGDGSERYEEAFENLGKALSICIGAGSDFAVLCGDVFDAPVPSHSCLYRAMEKFSCIKGIAPKVRVSIEKGGRQEDVPLQGFPVLVIHGNHEYVGKGSRSALDVLGFADLIVYFHAAKAIVEKGGEKVVVHGLGAVPEKRALEALRLWNPEPVAGACNILLLHQGFKEFMAIDDEMVATLSLDDIPRGFDLAVNGHLHWSSTQELGTTKFLLAGSTIATSIKRLESETPKGIHFFDTDTKGLSFVPLPGQRKMFYRTVMLRDADCLGAVAECRKEIEGCLAENTGLKPLVRVNLKGALKKGLSPSDVNLQGIIDEFSPRALLSISKNFSASEFRRKIADLREEQKAKMSVASLGFELLERHLAETDFGSEVPAKELFDLLAEEEMEKAMELLERK